MSAVAAESRSAAGQQWRRAVWTALGLGLMAALVVIAVADWTALWIAVLVAVVAFPVFLGANIVTAKYSSTTGERPPAEDDR